MSCDPRRSPITHPDATLFLRVSREGVFQHPRDFATVTTAQRAALGASLPAFDSHHVRPYRVVLKAFTEDVNFDTSLISTFVDCATEACVLTDFMEATHCGKTFGGNVCHTGSPWIALHDHFGCVKFQGNVNRNLVRHKERISDPRLEGDNDAACSRVFFAQLAFPRLVLLSGYRQGNR